jgi:hypothetical protein
MVMKHSSTRSEGLLRAANGSRKKRSRHASDQLDGASKSSDAIGESRRIMPEDNDELRRIEMRFRAAARKLEHIGALVDMLQHEIESIGPWLTQPVALRIMGAGSINLIIKAEILSTVLKGFALRLRRNEVQQRLPPEGRDT